VWTLADGQGDAPHNRQPFRALPEWGRKVPRRSSPAAPVAKALDSPQYTLIHNLTPAQHQHHVGAPYTQVIDYSGFTGRA